MKNTVKEKKKQEILGVQTYTLHIFIDGGDIRTDEVTAEPYFSSA